METNQFTPTDLHLLIVNLMVLRKHLAESINPLDIALNYPANEVIEQAEEVLIKAKNTLLSNLKTPLNIHLPNIYLHNASALSSIKNNANYASVAQCHRGLNNPNVITYNKAVCRAKEIISNAESAMQERWQGLFNSEGSMLR